MTDQFDALADLADATLVATALDRPGIDAAAVADAHHECANCNRPLAGNFCAHCGQKAHVHRSLLHVGEEFLHGITHFDGKAWKTLPMLLFRPGRLTRDYIMGKRARYIAPVPLFLLIVFLMFFVFSFVHIPTGGGATDSKGRQLNQAEAIRELPKVEAELAKIDADIKAMTNPGPGEVEALKGVRAGIVATRDQVKALASGEIGTPLDLPGELAREMKEINPTVQLGNGVLHDKARAALKNPELVLYKIQGKAYKLSFLLVPMSLPWLWLMFAFRRDVRLYDHAVFALYSISFMSLLFVIGSLAVTGGVSFGPFWFALVCVAPIAHMYAQLKGAYALTRFGASWRTAALTFAAIITLSLYAALMIVIGVLD